jgi:hypothetical protein
MTEGLTCSLTSWRTCMHGVEEGGRRKPEGRMGFLRGRWWVSMRWGPGLSLRGAACDEKRSRTWWESVWAEQDEERAAPFGASSMNCSVETVFSRVS